jgi:hypothetical protein
MIIDVYFGKKLGPQLRSLGLSPLQVSLITGDIRLRLESLQANWDDVRFRNTALLPALEVAGSYQPQAPLAIKALVVSAIRNSMLTELNASQPSNPAFYSVANCLTDELMPEITGGAIEFFVETWGERPNVAASKNDLFRQLAMKYPAAWRRFDALANSNQQEMHLEPEEIHPAPLEETEEPIPSKWLVESGYVTELGPYDVAILTAVRRQPNGLFFAPVFKMVSRNPEKVLRIIDMLVSWDKEFVTFNYFISKSYCARRKRLLSAPHDNGDVVRALRNCEGITPRHASCIKRVRM